MFEIFPSFYIEKNRNLLIYRENFSYIFKKFKNLLKTTMDDKENHYFYLYNIYRYFFYYICIIIDNFLYIFFLFFYNIFRSTFFIFF